MQKELSLKKITELWQNTSFGTNFYEKGTELSDTTFNLSIDENSEFTYQLFKGERSFLFNGSIISNASLEKLENSRMILALSFLLAAMKKSLIIHIEEGDKSMQIFLEPFCVHLSSTLYKAAPQKLIKYCRSRDDVKMIFDTLGFRAKNDIPKIWKSLQDELLSSFVAIKPETDWTIISLEKKLRRKDSSLWRNRHGKGK